MVVVAVAEAEVVVEGAIAAEAGREVRGKVGRGLVGDIGCEEQVHVAPPPSMSWKNKMQTGSFPGHSCGRWLVVVSHEARKIMRHWCSGLCPSLFLAHGNSSRRKRNRSRNWQSFKI